MQFFGRGVAATVVRSIDCTAAGLHTVAGSVVGTLRDPPIQPQLPVPHAIPQLVAAAVGSHGPHLVVGGEATAYQTNRAEGALVAYMRELCYRAIPPSLPRDEICKLRPHVIHSGRISCIIILSCVIIIESVQRSMDQMMQPDVQTPEAVPRQAAHLPMSFRWAVTCRAITVRSDEMDNSHEFLGRSQNSRQPVCGWTPTVCPGHKQRPIKKTLWPSTKPDKQFFFFFFSEGTRS